jgi:catechol 2,3-dioxygenase-like lactoylglutathione lyase family enzyme
MSTIKPTFRIFDYDKAVEFYIDWLGFKIDWVHEFEPGNSPKFIQVSLRDIILYLSEHHGDACPGSRVSIDHFKDLAIYHKELIDKNYKYNRPGLEVPEWNEKAIMMTVHDPFGNRITFGEEIR